MKQIDFSDSDINFVCNEEFKQKRENMNDPYLSEDFATKRLIAEYEKYNSLIIAFDFDDTIYDFHKKGYTYEAVIQLLRDLKHIGCYLICYTGNDNTDMIKRYLKTNDIPFDSINEQFPSYPNQSSRKIYANAYLDDRAGLSEVFKQLYEVIQFTEHKNHIREMRKNASIY